MCVDDLVCHGAEPLFVLDYISSGVVDPAQMAQLVAGVAEGCRRVGASLLGGEMAEHPGAMKPGQLDLVGFAVVGLEAHGVAAAGAHIHIGRHRARHRVPGAEPVDYFFRIRPRGEDFLRGRFELALEGEAWTLGFGHGSSSTNFASASSFSVQNRS